LTNFLDALDREKDPNPARNYTARVRGEAIDIPPPRVKSRDKEGVDKRVRRWMVNEEWLATGDNMNYDVPGRIGENGAAWGDFESEQVENNRKRVQEEKEIEKQRKKQKTGEEGSSKKSRKVANGRGKKGARASGKEKEKTVEMNYDDDKLGIY
jgi:sRNA-binding protein